MWVAEKSYVLDLYLTMTMAAVVTATRSNPKTFTNMWLWSRCFIYGFTLENVQTYALNNIKQNQEK